MNFFYLLTQITNTNNLITLLLNINNKTKQNLIITIINILIIIYILITNKNPQTLQILKQNTINIIFYNISIPNLNKLNLTQILTHFTHQPQIIFITTHNQHTIDTFELQTTNYIIKPIQTKQLTKTIHQIIKTQNNTPNTTPNNKTITIKLNNITHFIQHSQIKYIKTQNNYTKLHTTSDNHLMHIPLATLKKH